MLPTDASRFLGPQLCTTTPPSSVGLNTALHKVLAQPINRTTGSAAPSSSAGRNTELMKVLTPSIDRTTALDNNGFNIKFNFGL